MTGSAPWAIASGTSRVVFGAMNGAWMRCVLVALTVAIFASSCGAADKASDGVTGRIVVAAAASLAGAFEAIGKAFKEENAGVSLSFVFAGSSALATQSIEGAPADVFASADEESMAKLTSANLVADAPTVFARNSLTIVTKPRNPRAISGLKDLPAAGIISLCGLAVPCGKYAQAALEQSGVTIPESSVTRGQTATATLRAVADGDAVAGIVYVTDAKSNDKVATVDIPAADNVIAKYPIARLTPAGQSAVARAFVAHVLSEPGQRVLRSFGFLPAQ